MKYTIPNKIIFLIKQFFPRTFLFRSLVITGLLLLLIQTLIVIIFYDNQWRKINKKLLDNVVFNIVYVVKEANKTKDLEELKVVISQANKYVSIYPNIIFLDSINDSNSKNISAINKKLLENLQNFLTNDMYIYEYDDTYKIFKIIVNIRENIYLSFYLEKELFFLNSLSLLVILMIVFYLVAILIVAHLFRLQIRPLIKLSKATKKFGQGEKVAYLVPSGSIEIQQATSAFNEMRYKIESFLEQRNMMLSSVSHDLKTSLTKIKLILDMKNNKKENNQIQKEVDIMIEMIKSYLLFSKSNYMVYEKENIKLKYFFNDIEDAYKHKCEIIIINNALSKNINMNSILFKRIFENLLDNSISFANKIQITIENQGYHSLLFLVEDNGVGIKEELFGEVFKPFFRVNESRTPSNSNVGLGMYIVKDIIMQNGGNISLAKSKHLGGLAVSIILPL
jgi:two-component system osmolarity sensor histidine kinase EnvZ